MKRPNYFRSNQEWADHLARENIQLNQKLDEREDILEKLKDVLDSLGYVRE